MKKEIGTQVIAEITSRLTDEIRETIVGTYQGIEGNYALVLQADGRMRHVEHWLVETSADRAIRTERRELKRREREAKREARLRRRLTHESVVRNGVPPVRSGGTELGIHDAIAYSPLVICAGCAEAVREILDADGLCEKCKYEKEVLQGEHISERLEQGRPREGGREEKEGPTPGRPTLKL